MKVAITLLGSPQASIGGDPLRVDTRKAVALLAYLATHDRPQSRDHLAGLLWPDYDQDRARAVLRRTLSSLKAGLGEGLVHADRNVVSIDLSDVELDVAAFRTSLASAKSATDPSERVVLLEKAVSSHRGHFLEGFALRDADTFDDWQSQEAEVLRRELTEALDLLIEAAASTGRTDTAITAASRRLALDPLSESTHRGLMHLHARTGDRSAAVRQYRTCVTLLEQELGVEPAQATTALYEAITEGNVEADLEVPPPPAGPNRPLPIPLVGRDAEMRSLKQAFQEARGGGGVVAIEGEAGVGKTRMLEELIAGAGPNVTVGHARGHGAESGVAYGVITQVLQTVLTPEVAAGLPGSVATELARLLPELGETAEARDHPAAVSRFFEAIRIAIEMGLSRGEEGLLAIDDAHWLDAASIDVLAYFLRRLPAGICVALTWRPEEMGNDRNLQRIVGEAIEEKGGVHIALDRLGRDDVAALVSATHPEADVGVLTDRLMTETEGLPFFVAEYLSASGDDPEWSVPVPVRDLLRDRLDGVSDIGRQVLGTAAVIDRAFDFDTLWRASGRSELEAVDALDELSRWGLVRALDPDEPLYEFSHDKLRTVVLEEMSPVRRRVLHRRIAEALAAAAGRSPASSGAIATHYAAAGAGPEAGRFFTLAGDHARALFAHRDAVAHYEAALGAGVDEPGPLHEAIGDLQVLLGDYLAARLGYERAAASMPEAVARLERKLGEVNLRRGDWDLARAHLERALVDATDERAEVLGDLAIVALRRNDLDAAANHASAAEIEARSAGPDVQAQVENVAGKTAAAAGDVDRARHHLEQSLGLARTAQDEGAVIAALNNLALLHRDTGDNPAAITLTEEALVACRRIGDRHHEAALENNLADLLNASGDRETAMDHLKRATAIFAEIGDEPEGPVPEVWKLVDW